MLKNWNFYRILRLLIGIAVLIEASYDDMIFLYIIGIFLTLHAVLGARFGGVGCANDSCSIQSDYEREDPLQS